MNLVATIFVNASLLVFIKKIHNFHFSQPSQPLEPINFYLYVHSAHNCISSYSAYIVVQCTPSVDDIALLFEMKITLKKPTERSFHSQNTFINTGAKDFLLILLSNCYPRSQVHRT